ncbi:hypothetical protein [Longimicrobium sp.]|uniref:hypothetical protein n=1 Tax=Longimicrobium sp. TaxID=2029185 RepID=UPI002CC9671E|nr:hypothetical protein [Longimicrobium sp.]HSU16698.1 hypothetical protein [Longimicrobium sp.]
MKGVRLSLRRLTARWKLKLAALALAILLWVVVSAEQTTTQWIPVRVDPVVRDPEFVLAGGPEPGVVRVRFQGPGRELWELALERPVLVLPLREVGNARSFAIDPAMVTLPEGVRNVRATDVRPAIVRVELQRLATRSVPVRPRFGAQSLQRYVVGDSPAVFPAEVRLTGPEEALAQVESVPTRAFEIVPDDSAFSQRVFLDTAGLHGITLSTQEVRVRGRVDRRVDRVFAMVPVSAPEKLMVSPAQVRVTVSGPDRRVRQIAPPSLRARVPRDSLPATVPGGGMQAPVVVDGLPPGVTAHAVPGRVQVMPEPAMPGLPPIPPDSGVVRPR